MQWRIGHRGASGAYPENTMLAFKKAIELGANGIECDVHVCKSREVVVIHDTTLERTTNGKGRVHDLTLGELKKLDAGKGETIPTLEEVLLAYAGKITVFIETKSDEVAEPAARIITQLAKTRGLRLASMPVISFSEKQLLAVQAVNPRILTGATPGKQDESRALSFIERAKANGMWSINPNINGLKEEHVKAAHAAGLKVITWTANSQQEIDKAYTLGVDGVMSDWPEQLERIQV